MDLTHFTFTQSKNNIQLRLITTKRWVFKLSSFFCKIGHACVINNKFFSRIPLDIELKQTKLFLMKFYIFFSFQNVLKESKFLYTRTSVLNL